VSSGTSGGGITAGVRVIGGDSVAMKVFPPPRLFSLMFISFHVKLLKIQMCHPICICFKLGPHSFDSICFYFKVS